MLMLKMSCLMTKPTKWHVHPAKTQICLGIRPVWSVFNVRMKKAWVLSYPLSTQRRLWSDWVDAQADLSLCWCTVILLALSWGGSNYLLLSKPNFMSIKQTLYFITLLSLFIKASLVINSFSPEPAISRMSLTSLPAAIFRSSFVCSSSVLEKKDGYSWAMSRENLSSGFVTSKLACTADETS